MPSGRESFADLSDVSDNASALGEIFVADFSYFRKTPPEFLSFLDDFPIRIEHALNGQECLT